MKKIFNLILVILVVFVLFGCGEKYTITFDVNGGNELENNQIEVVYGEVIELPVPTKNNSIFLGWYYDNKEVSNIGDINSDAILVAKWISVYEENGKSYIDLGKYPQSLVTDVDLINKLNNITATNSLGYIEYEGKEYKKVVAAPFISGYTFMNDSQIIEGNTYYFNVEPIKWRVLQESDGIYKLLSEYILDNTEFYKYFNDRIVDEKTICPNNYEYSNIRAWLNGYNGSSYNVDDYTNKGFLDVAFNNKEKNIINTALVDNSAISTSKYNNKYVCNNTNDKIYPLSYHEAQSSKYELGERNAKVSDYARSKGCYMEMMYDSMGNANRFYGDGIWCLRSPGTTEPIFVCAVNGTIFDEYLGAHNAGFGIRPALEITIK